MDCSMLGSPVHHQLPEPTQTHVHRIGDAIQPSHPLSCPSPPAFNLAQHQGLFQWVNSSHHVAKVLELQHQSFQLNIQDWSPLGLTGLISSQSKGLFKSLLQHHSLALPFFGIEMKMVLFQYYGHCRVFPICWHIECRTLKASSFRILNSSTGIPSPSLALFIMMLPKLADWLWVADHNIVVIWVIKTLFV